MVSTTPQDQPQDAPAAGYGAAPPPPPAPGYAPPLPEAYGPPISMYASWIRRVAAFLLDDLLVLPFVLLLGVGIAIGVASVNPADNTVHTGSATIGMFMALAGWIGAVAVQIWNRAFRQGRTGQSWGKTIIGITLVAESTGQPVGPLLAFGRELLHVLDAIFYLGYLWPLWDTKRQTFSDKICRTVVLADA